ncbi:MAG: hypothetical protein P4L81_00485 [Candidatus Pacebacteria bacterium]|nr:hypothetical protein [Candidatus Paceibacterota bacterium]
MKGRRRRPGTVPTTHQPRSSSSLSRRTHHVVDEKGEKRLGDVPAGTHAAHAQEQGEQKVGGRFQSDRLNERETEGNEVKTKKEKEEPIVRSAKDTRAFIVHYSMLLGLKSCNLTQLNVVKYSVQDLISDASSFLGHQAQFAGL